MSPNCSGGLSLPSDTVEILIVKPVEVENVGGSLIVICHRSGLGFVSMLSTT
jgi:hypothetical protein